MRSFLSTVVHVDDSSYRRQGTRILIRGDSQLTGRSAVVAPNAIRLRIRTSSYGVRDLKRFNKHPNQLVKFRQNYVSTMTESLPSDRKSDTFYH